MSKLQIKNHISLDISVERTQNVRCVEEDRESRIIEIVITNNGKPYDVFDDISVFFKMIKPDNTMVFWNLGDEHFKRVNTNTFQVTLDDRCMSIPGICKAEIQLARIEGDQSKKEILTSMIFNIVVCNSIYSSEQAESSSDFSGIIDKIIEIYNKFKEFVTEALKTKMDKHNPTGTGSLLLNNNNNGYEAHNSVISGEGNASVASNTLISGDSNSINSVGDNSTIFGYNNYSNSMNSLTVGSNLSNESHDDSLIIGRYNDNDLDEQILFTVGNGNRKKRSNAHVLYSNGNAEYAGDVKANACGGNNPISLLEVEANMPGGSSNQKTGLYTDNTFGGQLSLKSNEDDEIIMSSYGNNKVAIGTYASDGDYHILEWSKNSDIDLDTINANVSDKVGYSIGLSINESTYVMTLQLLNSKGTAISTKTVDLPLETMVVSAKYENKKLILTLQNGQTLTVDISDILSGLVNDSTTIAGIDLKDNITKEELIAALELKPVSISGSFNDLDNKPQINGIALIGNKTNEELNIHIPTNVSELENDENYLKEVGWNDINDKPFETIDENTLKVVDGELKVIGGGGGGTSDYEDLNNLPKVNDVTIIGNLSLADLKIRRELTQSEYDELSEEEKNNGTEYIITDANYNSKDNIVTFESNDDGFIHGANIQIDKFQSNEKHSSLFSKISSISKVVRWLKEYFNETDILGSTLNVGNFNILINENRPELFANNSIVCGKYNITTAHSSIISGNYINSSGNNTNTLGMALDNNYDNKTVVGQGNEDKSDDLFEVGNGEYMYDQELDIVTKTPSNAFEVKKNGNIEAKGDIIANGCGGENPVSLIDLGNRVVYYKSLDQFGMSSNYTLEEVILAMPNNSHVDMSFGSTATLETTLGVDMPTKRQGVLTIIKPASTSSNKASCIYVTYKDGDVYTNSYYTNALSGWKKINNEFKNGDVVTMSESFVVSAIITGSTKTLTFSIPLSNRIESNITTVSISSLKAGFRLPTGGYLEKGSDSMEWVGKSGITVSGVIEQNTNSIKVTLANSTTYKGTDGSTAVTNNIPLVGVVKLTMTLSNGTSTTSLDDENDKSKR